MVILNLLGGHRNVEFSSFLSIHLYQLLPNFFLTLFFWTSNLSGDWKLGQIVVFFFFFFFEVGPSLLELNGKFSYPLGLPILAF